ncbi:Aspartate--tRNA ligase, mitochondrial [Toxocara canis]|uniref:Aspartate--tRNA ligase, mitochondrial n=1 Tax=Toxocara canis TaxID=6265 RepID=A0A0B2VZ55_TOXCA|nr:Aspartate--tRNA ligase, mitochondrial [Toxocara canis]
MLARTLTQRLLGRSLRAIYATNATNDYTLRTHTCGELRIQHKDKSATIYGWLAFKRMDRFLVLRDAYGSVQVRIPDSRTDLIKAAAAANYESVLKVTGVIADRGTNRNPSMKTGDVEVVAEELQVVNNSPSQLPYSSRSQSESTEKTRLRYRYLDLRTDRMQRALRLRSEVTHLMRRFLNEEAKFVEVETPTLFRRTPGGANEFIVPAPKPNLGKFYSLPQSPQQFKQLLMCGGLDRYFQIARCYRDEGSKLDRQPEFTQVDVELSFTTQSGVMQLIEDLIVYSWPNTLENLKPTKPFKRITFAEAYRLYGIDKPDLRVPWIIADCSDQLAFLNSSECSDFAVRIFVAKGVAKKITRANRAEWKRLVRLNARAQENLKPTKPFKRITFAEAYRLYGIDKPDLRVPWIIADCSDQLAFLNSSECSDFAVRIFVAKGVAKKITRANRAEWKRLVRLNARAQRFDIFTTSQKHWFSEIPNAQLMQKYGITEEDAAVISWGTEKDVQWTLGQLRHLIADGTGLRSMRGFEFVWVTDFPLFVRNDDGRLESAHHPFTASIPEHEHLIFRPEQLENITAQHYDLVLNGVELGGGSIRIHNAEMQRYVIEKILGESAENLNHLLEALSFGAPPHGGFAIGLDRYIALLLGNGDSSVGIREVIAFPKSKEGRDLMSDCPADPLDEQLDRYGISVKLQKEERAENIMADS